jgi:hypothetical protein
MPMFGAVTTGDVLNATFYQGLYQVVPDVDAQVQKLRADLQCRKRDEHGLNTDRNLPVAP